MLAFELCAGNNRDGLFSLFLGGHDGHDFQKLSEMSLGPEKAAAFLDVVDVWLSLYMLEF